MAVKRRRPRKKALTLSRRVGILESYCEAMLAKCQLELDTRLKAVEKKVGLR